jgi:hypothetical protein
MNGSKTCAKGYQCCGSGIWCFFLPLDPGGEKIRIRDENAAYISNFGKKNFGLKIIKFFDADPQHWEYFTGIGHCTKVFVAAL